MLPVAIDFQVGAGAPLSRGGSVLGSIVRSGTSTVVGVVWSSLIVCIVGRFCGVVHVDGSVLQKHSKEPTRKVERTENKEGEMGREQGQCITRAREAADNPHHTTSFQKRATAALGKRVIVSVINRYIQ